MTSTAKPVASNSVTVRQTPLTQMEAPCVASLTTLGHKGVGDVVNLEVDVIAKYVERLLDHRGTDRREVGS